MTNKTELQKPKEIINVNGDFINLSEISSIEGDVRDWCKVYFKNGHSKGYKFYSYISKKLSDYAEYNDRQTEQRDEKIDALLSSYGDAWYDGFLAAKDLADSLGEYTESNILNMSEHAESEYLKMKTND